MMRVVGNKLLGVCPCCAKIVRMDKPIFGSLHICTLPEEREKYGAFIARRAAEAERQLADIKN